MSRLFLRDHLALILLQPVQWALVLLIYWLDGYRNLAVAFYAGLLGIVLCIGYLSFRYVQYSSYYKRLADRPSSLDAIMQPLGHAPVAEALQQLLDNQYTLMQEQLHQAENQQKTHMLFMNQWVHQMKTPIAIMDLTLQEEQSMPYTASMREELERLRQGLDTVLYVARLQSFEQDFHVKTVSLTSIAEQAVHEHKRLFIRSQVFPELVGNRSILVQTDEKWFMFMLGQLLTNAIKYSTGPMKKVTVRIYVDLNHAAVEIRDRGIGIPKTDLKRVYDPFFTGDNGRQFRESTGMGLYLVKQACEKLGHELQLESAVGEGTVVRIKFMSWQHAANM